MRAPKFIPILNHKTQPILFNSNHNKTNFIYKIVGGNFSQTTAEDINTLNTNSSITDRISRILSLGAKIVFHQVENPTFDYNLKKIDVILPDILGILLLEYFSGKGSLLSKLTKRLDKENPLRFPFDTTNFYSHKIKRFLSEIVLGFTPRKTSDETYLKRTAHIIVQKENKKLHYHILHSNEFKNFLLNETMLETSSTKRNEFGKIQSDKFGNRILKLNLQIRFK